MRHVVGLVLVFAILAGCASNRGEDSIPAATEATTASATPTPESPPPTYVAPPPDPCPVGAPLCDAATAIRDALAAADFAGIDAVAEPRPFTCPGGTPHGAGGPYPLCDGAEPGEMRSGFPVHYLNSEGVVEASLLPALRAGVIRGLNGVTGPYANEPRIIGFHCPLEGGEPDCSTQAVVYFEGSPHIGFQAEGEQFKVGWLQFGDFAEDPSVFVRGGDLTFAHETARPGLYIPWRTPNTPDPGNLVRERWLFAPVEISGLEADPARGACPVSLRLRAPGASSLVDPKGPAITSAHVFKGVVSIEDNIADRAVPREEIGAVPVAGPDQYDIALDPSMFNGTLCEPGVLTVVTGGALGWLSTGYRVTGP